jgi:hypothetical protein
VRRAPLLAFLAFLAAGGCAALPDSAERVDGDVIVRGGLPVRVTAYDSAGPHAFATEDGVHWRRCLPSEPVAPEAPGEATTSPGFRVTRDYDSEDPDHGRWRVWQLSGITWRLIATLPDDASLGF